MRIAEQQGLALINLIVLVALTAIFAVGGGVTTVQIMGVTSQNQDINTAVRNAQNAGFVISQDLLAAESVSCEDDPAIGDTEFLCLFWKDWETGFTYDIRYIWQNPADA